MKKIYMVLGAALATILSSTSGYAQWSFTVADQADTITFDEVVPGVVNDFNGAGITPTPTNGQLDAYAWRITGLSDNSSFNFGDTETTGDFARGASAGSTSSGGVYGFEVATGDTALGIQPGSSDFTPGDIDLLIINNTGASIDTLSVSYEFWVYNDQARSNSYDFSYLIGSTTGTFTAVAALSDTTVETAAMTPAWMSNTLSANIPVSIASGDTIVLRWTGDDNTGGGSRDEVAFDDIIVELKTAATSPMPTADSLVITEIMYNLPGTDSVEFIEMQNVGSTPLDVTGFYFTQGVVDTFPSISINPGAYLLYTNDSIEFFNKYGFSAYEWNSGSLSNSGEDITIQNASGVTVDSVDYDDGAPWPTDADGNGWSLTLSDPSLDNNVATNWCLSGTLVPGYIQSGTQIYASPGASDTCYVAPVITNVPTYPIADINNVDANGVADSLNVYCWTKGVVLGVNMNGNGLSFTIWDNEGIGVYSNSTVTSNYTVTEGDSVLVRGTVDQFMGLTQITPDSIQLLNAGNTIPTPTVVTTLGENTESELVRFENALVSNISGSNYTLISGNDTIVMRIDSDTDVDDSLTFVVGDSLCHIIGIGGQFDNSNPYTSGYQIFPRYYTDIDTSCGGVITPPTPVINTYDIEVLRTVDANGEVDSLGVYCAVEGIVYGVDLDGNNGLSFFIKDETGGINVWNPNDVDAYVVTEGDEIRVVGEILMFNGLAEISPDSITILSTNNCIPFPRVVTDLDESTESDYIELRNVFIAPGQFWPAPTFNENLDIVTQSGDTLTMRIDKDTYLPDSILSAPSGVFNLVGIGSQFDASAPYDEGYQIFPMFPYDFDTVPDVAPDGLVINEVITENDALNADGNGEFDNWIELYNGGSTTVDLVGMYVTGDLGAAQAGGELDRIPRCFNNASVNLTLAPNDWTLIWADSQPEQGPNHLDISLDLLPIYPAIATADLGTTIDSIQVPNLGTDYTYGRRNDGDTAWVTFEVGTPDASNNGGVILSIENISATTDFVVYPNPVSGSELFFNQVVDVTMFNTTGKVVLDAKQVNRIAVDQFDAGVYIIRTANADVVKVVVR